MNLRGNNLKQAHLGNFLQAIKDNVKTLRLVHLDMSNNQLNDQSGVVLARALKNIKTMESVNLCNNLLAGESSDALLFLVKENRSITKCVADNNMIKAHALTEIERTCKSNKTITT